MFTFISNVLNFKVNVNENFKSLNYCSHILKISSKENVDYVKMNKLPIQIDYNSIIKKFSNEKYENILSFVKINREFFSYQLLVQLTFLKIKLENEYDEFNQIASFYKLRSHINKSINYIDRNINNFILKSEKIIKTMVDNESIDYIEIIGDIELNRISVNAFWIVITSAIIAWEEKIKNESYIDQKTYLRLLDIKKNLFQSIEHSLLISHELKILDAKLFSKDVNHNIEISDIEGIRLLITIAERLQISSYGVLVRRLKLILDEVNPKYYGFKFNELTNNSGFLNIKKTDVPSRLSNIKIK
ncbi:hypothetical protein (nucleomorph) [Guillardia theta]|uniref:Uncharacterized protein n=1 Tax=Guillardia theta TaxID=55529 RepID=Q98SA9_GUITH|nr:hypothetical protein GTHECHR3030 [Guillardia theta]AAK39674.1 hypothetical protein [Guillardia theta]|mmetsp:Transcript_20214/g.67524  ORF Transcript_20214/g.67524 Transcript_20214/m.67524 type:complete len:302 (+) Transcript_20214:11130-12035(+)